MCSVEGFKYKEALLKRGISTSESLVESLRNCEYDLLKRLSIKILVKDLVSHGCISDEEGSFFVMQRSVVGDYNTVTKCAISNKKNLYREWQLFYGTINRLKLPVCYAPVVLLMYLCYYGRDFEFYLKEDKLSVDIEARGICDIIYRFLYQLKVCSKREYRAVGFLFTGFSKSGIENYLHIENSEDFYCMFLERLRTVISVELERKQMFSVV